MRALLKHLGDGSNARVVAEHALLVASKVADVEVMKILVPKCGKEGRARALLEASKSGVGAGVLGVFFDEEEEGEEEVEDIMATLNSHFGAAAQGAGDENFKKSEVTRMVVSCSSRNQLSALEAILPLISSRSGEIAGGRTGVLAGICKQALTVRSAVSKSAKT